MIAVLVNTLSAMKLSVMMLIGDDNNKNGSEDNNANW